MTTTISKHELQQIMLLQEQQQQQFLQLQQSYTSTLHPTAPTISAAVSNFAINNTVNSVNNQFTITAAAAKKPLDSFTPLPTIVQRDSSNNNHTDFNINNNSSVSNSSVTPTYQPHTPTLTSQANNNNDTSTQAGGGCTSSSPEESQTSQTKRIKRRSLLSFKSLDFHIKSLYSGLRSSSQKNSESQSSSLGGGHTTSSMGANTPPPCRRRRPSAPQNRMPPYLKIEAVDSEESANLLLDYPQSPYTSRRNSANDDTRAASQQLLHIQRFGEGGSRSQASSRSPSPSPYFLSPYAMGSGNVRRSSTSDIATAKRSGASSASDSRRPSTSDLLRKARERRGSEARMGRSVSHGGLTRGGAIGGGGRGGGGRRTSLAL